MTVPPFHTAPVRQRILLAQPPSVLREMQRLLLQAAGHLVTTCGDAASALGVPAMEAYDAVVLNADPSGETSSDYLHALLRRCAHAQVIIVADVTPERSAQLIALGAVAVVPFATLPQELVRTITGLICPSFRARRTDPAAPAMGAVAATTARAPSPSVSFNRIS